MQQGEVITRDLSLFGNRTSPVVGDNRRGSHGGTWKRNHRDSLSETEKPSLTHVNLRYIFIVEALHRVLSC
jgi:hypothetical protein